MAKDTITVAEKTIIALAIPRTSRCQQHLFFLIIGISLPIRIKLYHGMWVVNTLMYEVSNIFTNVFQPGRTYPYSCYVSGLKSSPGAFSIFPFWWPEYFHASPQVRHGQGVYKCELNDVMKEAETRRPGTGENIRFAQGYLHLSITLKHCYLYVGWIICEYNRPLKCIEDRRPDG